MIQLNIFLGDLMFMFLRGSLVSLQIPLYSAQLFLIVKARFDSCWKGFLWLVTLVLTDCTFLLRRAVGSGFYQLHGYLRLLTANFYVLLCCH